MSVSRLIQGLIWVQNGFFRYSHTRWKNYALIFLLVQTSYFAIAQDGEMQFEPVLVSHGLVQSDVKDIHRDKYGYVWFGTRGGLSRYDGIEFVNYIQNPDDSTSISNSSIWSLGETPDGNLWVGTSDGLNKYDWSKEHFINYVPKRLKENRINEIYNWSRDTLLLATHQGIHFFDIKAGKLVDVPGFEAIRDEHIEDITIGPDGTIVLGTYTGVKVFKQGTIHQLLDEKVKAVHIDQLSNIWVATELRLYWITQDLSEVVVLEEKSDFGYLAEIMEDPEGNVVIAKGRLDIYDSTGKKRESYQQDQNKEYSILHNSITCVEIDRDGIWWIGFNGYGANKHDPNRPLLGFLGQDPGKKPSLSSNYVSGIYTEDDQLVFIATSSGLDVYNKKASLVKPLLSGQRIDYLFPSTNGLWVATQDTLVLVDMKTSLIKKKYYVQGLARTKYISTEEDHLWIANETGLLKFNTRTNVSNILLPNDPKIPTPTRDWVTAIYKLDDRFILGTSVGMYEMDIDSEVVRKIEEPLFQLIDKSFIKFIERDSRGIIWVGTWGDGLFRWDIKDGSFEQFTTKDGLPDNVVYGMLEDEKGILWMSTNRGLTCYNDPEKRFVNLDVNYGLQSNEFNTSAYFKSPKGTFYFGGIEGLNYFNPGNVENPTRSETRITGVYISNQRVAPYDLGLTGSIMDEDTIVLDYQQNILSFDFKSSNLTISRLNNYAYYLEGLEETWNYVGARRFANYSGLQPGEYVFWVKSSNNHGLWDETPAQMLVVIRSPFWMTSWFRALVVLALLFLGFVFYRWRVFSLKKSEAKLKNLVLERTKELSKANSKLNKTNKSLEKSLEKLNETQHQLIQSEKMAAIGILSAGVGHEINNPLNFVKNGVANMEFELTRGKKPLSEKVKMYFDVIYEGVERMSKIVSSLSQFSRSGSSDEEECDIHAIIDNCLVILNSKIKYKVEIVKKYAKQGIVVKGNGGKLHQVFLNILANAEQAIKTKGSISIDTRVNKKYIYVTISDTGEGIDVDEINKIMDPFFTTKAPGKGTGLGLSITHAIIEEHGGSLRVASEKGKGSAFTISLPLN